jgi:hypothetical protein
MILEWHVTRQPPEGDAILGTFDLGTGLTCVSLERVQVAIPLGRYRVTLTESQRAKMGTLWAPYPDFRLPLLNDVPFRTGIRIHAFNTAYQSEGCIGVGTDHTNVELDHSRPAVTRIVNAMRDAEQHDDEVWITIQEATS